MARFGGKRAYGPPPSEPDVLFESRLFPVGFLSVVSLFQLGIDYFSDWFVRRAIARVQSHECQARSRCFIA